MPGVILFAELRRPEGMRGSFSKMVKDTLLETGHYWHRELLPGHFTPSNRARFHHQPRTQVYESEIKKEAGVGQGKYVDNLLKGKSRRFMLAFATVTGSSKGVTVRLKPPAYFAKPYVGPLPGGGRITQQPDKPKEIAAVDPRDAESMAKFAAERLRLRIQEGFRISAKRIRG